MGAGTIRVGVGGWDYDPWRQFFYPPGLPKTKQLEHAASKLTAIEINATYYKLQKPELFAKWAQTVPERFRFTIKGSRFCTNKKVLGEGGEGVERFCTQGFTELGDKLGPILWQFMATKAFDPEDFQAFLKLLPGKQDGIPLRHAVEVRHESFRDVAFIEMARRAAVAIVFGDSDEFPCMADVSGDFVYARLMRAFVYARLMRARADEATGYEPAALDRWASIARRWAAGESPAELPYACEPAPKQPRDTYVFFISGAKERNPAAAMALIDRL